MKLTLEREFHPTVRLHSSWRHDAADDHLLSVPAHQSVLSDWMILDGDKCYGGYTVRVLSEMEPENAPPFEFLDLEGTGSAG